MLTILRILEDLSLVFLSVSCFSSAPSLDGFNKDIFRLAQDMCPYLDGDLKYTSAYFGLFLLSS